MSNAETTKNQETIGRAALSSVELTVEQVQAAFESGVFTAESLVRTCLDRIATYNPKYNAIIFLNPEALDDARAIDRRRAAGEKLGPLAGVPVVVEGPSEGLGTPVPAPKSVSGTTTTLAFTSSRIANPETQKLPALAPGASWAVSVRVELTEKAKEKSTLSLTGTAPGVSVKGSLVVKLEE